MSHSPECHVLPENDPRLCSRYYNITENIELDEKHNENELRDIERTRPNLIKVEFGTPSRVQCFESDDVANFLRAQKNLTPRRSGKIHMPLIECELTEQQVQSLKQRTMPEDEFANDQDNDGEHNEDQNEAEEEEVVEQEEEEIHPEDIPKDIERLLKRINPDDWFVEIENMENFFNNVKYETWWPEFILRKYHLEQLSPSSSITFKTWFNERLRSCNNKSSRANQFFELFQGFWKLHLIFIGNHNSDSAEVGLQSPPLSPYEKLVLYWKAYLLPQQMFVQGPTEFVEFLLTLPIMNESEDLNGDNVFDAQTNAFNLLRFEMDLWHREVEIEGELRERYAEEHGSSYNSTDESKYEEFVRSKSEPVGLYIITNTPEQMNAFYQKYFKKKQFYLHDLQDLYNRHSNDLLHTFPSFAADEKSWMNHLSRIPESLRRKELNYLKKRY